MSLNPGNDPVAQCAHLNDIEWLPTDLSESLRSMHPYGGRQSNAFERSSCAGGGLPRQLPETSKNIFGEKSAGLFPKGAQTR